MADRKAGSGHFGLRGMISLEPFTIAGCGYPNLLASGEVCEGEAIHDRQHPHDLFMELAATYDRPLGGDAHLQLYGGPFGEPALGPVAFPHRISAMPNPVAPITHHWLDATHITYGVVTGGVYGKRWKAEASVFNGREPDETRTNFDFAAMDSYRRDGSICQRTLAESAHDRCILNVLRTEWTFLHHLLLPVCGLNNRSGVHVRRNARPCQITPGSD
jgi:hypothetical protein